MKRDSKRAAAVPQPRSRASEAIIYLSMVLVAATVAVALVVQAGYPTPTAAAISFATLAAFVLGHALMNKSRKTAPSRRAPARQAARPPQPDDAPVTPEKPVAPPFPRHDGAALPGAAVPPPIPPMSPALQQPPPLAATPPLAPPPIPPVAHDPLDAVPHAPMVPNAPMEAEPAPLPPLGLGTAEEPQLSSLRPPKIPGQQPSQGAEKDFWSFAPGAPHSPDQPPAPPDAPLDDPSFELPPLTALPDPLPEQARQSTSPRQEDVEVIQGLIKKLADEVNAHEDGQAKAPPPDNPSDAEPPSLEASLAALRTTASTMRNASPDDDAPSAPASESTSDIETGKAETRADEPGETPPPIPEQRHAKAETLSDAIKTGRIDVLLEPILGLGDQRAEHYEVSLRLRDEQGTALDYGSEDRELSGTGFLPLVDGARIARTINVAQRLGERGKSGSVFSAYHGESLTAGGFLSDVSAALEGRPATAGHLVLTFSQHDVRAFESPEWIALADLSRLGFRFALSGVSDLNMDFESLVRAGFAFVKLDADVFLEGLKAPEGLLPSADVCRHFAGLGMTLIVQGIDEGTKLAQIFGFGVLLGQGQLFGAPRPVKADALTARQDAAA